MGLVMALDGTHSNKLKKKKKGSLGDVPQN
jgi:hypothetical protein